MDTLDMKMYSATHVCDDGRLFSVRYLLTEEEFTELSARKLIPANASEIVRITNIETEEEAAD